MIPRFSTGISHLAFIGKNVGDSRPIEDPLCEEGTGLDDPLIEA